ncbi:MAG: hypothetical protein PHY77_05050 [Desulfotomaculaceae bacterium]|nr:hypothetical protein [Desulfotomaculaceae bacterium]
MIILFRAIGRQPRRYEPRGKYDVPREGLPYYEKEMPYNENEMLYAEEEMPYSEEELPPAGTESGYAGRRQGPTVVRGNLNKESSHESRPEGPVRERRQNTGSRQELHVICSDDELFADGLSRQEVIKGMVWSQVLGPRGGIQATRPSRYRS